MTVTPSELETSTAAVVESDLDIAAEQAFAADADLDLGIPDEVPSADDPSSRAAARDIEGVGFTLDEFASLLSKYDYNFKPGDVVKGAVFAIESKGAMIDIGAKTAAFMPMQEVSINRVEGIADVLEPGEEREFFILSEENEDGQLTLDPPDRVPARLGAGASAPEGRRHHLQRGVRHQPWWCPGAC